MVFKTRARTGAEVSADGKLAWRLTVDVSVLVALASVLVYYAFFAAPRRTGFFCDDPALSHPYLSSTIPSTWLYVPATLLALVVVVATECVRRRSSEASWKRCLADVYVHFVVWFGFGALATAAVTYLVKFNACRLRPHFFAVCRPEFAAAEPRCSSGTFVADYECSGLGFSEKRMRDAFVSFPSGHASYGFYVATFLLLYVGARWNRNVGGVIVRPFVQLAFLVAELMVCISRVNDFKHFPSDVAAGGILGMSVALFVYNVLDLDELRSGYFFDGRTGPVGNGRASFVEDGPEVGLRRGLEPGPGTGYSTFPKVANSRRVENSP